MTSSDLETRLKPVRARMGANRFLSGALLGLGAGWGAAALLLLVDKLFYLPLPLHWVPWAATVAPLAGAATAAFLRRASSRQAAVLVDSRLSLAERLSSALLVPGETPMEVAVRADAGRHLDRLRPEQACPVTLPRRRAWISAASLTALALALAAPRWDLFQRGKTAEGRAKALADVKTKGAILEKRVEKLMEEARRQGVDTGEIGKGLESLVAQLKEGVPDPKAALAEISDQQARLKAEMDQFKDRDQAARAKDLQKALQALGSEQGKTPGRSQADSLKDLVQDLRDLAKKAGEGTASPAEVAEMQKALSSLAESLGKTEATRELASELTRAAEALDKQPGSMPEMSDSLKNLADQMAQMDKALDREQMMEMAKSELEALKQQLSGQDPWKGEVSEADKQAFEQRRQELAQNPPPGQPGGT